ncbi:unnamed protein product, partial [Vitis vinifera]|uniref:Uncharacterized protein n=1 Tax=Vitis vinifera TaxID=29760 RepID=D7SXZ4_VITVI
MTRLEFHTNHVSTDKISQPTNKFRFKSVNILVDITIPITDDAFSQFRTQSITFPFLLIYKKGLHSQRCPILCGSRFHGGV